MQHLDSIGGPTVLDKATSVGFIHFMISRMQLAEAIERNEPFTISLADGKDYNVPHRDYISIAPHREYFVVHNDEGYAHILPIPLVTAIRYRNPSQALQPAS